ncbi:MAG: hypothetical protein ACKO2L_07765, partial [Planctomycetaceae bacterium]
MTRPASRIIPWTDLTLTQSVPRPLPRPEFNHRMQPQAEVPAGHIAPHIPDLLFTSPMHLLDIMKVLLDRS